MAVSKTIRDLPLFEWGATYDAETNKIHGCTTGSKSWWHEKRHQWQYKTFERPLTGFKVVAGVTQMVAPFALLMGEFKLLVVSVGAMLPVALLVFLMELDAEIVSWMMYLADVPVPEVRDGSD